MTDRVVVLSGSGLSAESDLPTFRDAAGLWRQHSWTELASPEGWRKNPALVLEFYNERRAKAWAAQPNAAHLAIASLEEAFDVVVGTSLSVYPAAGLVDAARNDAIKVLNALEMDDIPAGFDFRPGRATAVVPAIVAAWLESAGA